MTRPPVSIVIAVTDSHAASLARRAPETLALDPRDEVVIAVLARDHRPLAPLNDTVATAGCEWLLFLSGEGEPPPGLLDAYFADPPSQRCGALLGGPPNADPVPFNLLVRAKALESVGGFAEDVSCGAALDLCQRLATTGWEVLERASASVPRQGRPELGSRFRRGAGTRWLERRLRQGGDGDMAAGARLASPARRSLALQLGRLAARNRAKHPLPERLGTRLCVWTDAYPARSETFIYNEVDALRRQGWAPRVEAAARPARIEQAVARRHEIDYLEDEPPLQSVLALLAVTVRHPLRVLADVRSRGRWRTDEEPLPLRSIAPAIRRLRRAGDIHVHVHFLAGAALSAMRICGIAGIPYSVIGHGYDVFAQPRNLLEKIANARFAAAPCAYTARHMRALDPARRRVEVIVMGVDVERFRRRRPYPGKRAAIAVGRLVEKKGFEYLIEATASLESRAPLDRLTIVGDGPLREKLEGRIAELGLGERVEIVEAWGAREVAARLERADVLIMPAVVAEDGDRDAMPVVVKEALAMEVPVVASREVGLPEVVRPEWGLLVPPRDADALAEALETVLAASPVERAGMGSRGRAHVSEHCSLQGQAERLSGLILA